MSRTSAAPVVLTRPLLAIPVGIVVGIVVAAAFSVNPLLVALPLGAMAALLPLFLLRDGKLYFLTLFVLMLQFDVKKFLLDGLVILETLGFEHSPWVFVPEIRGSDLPFLALLILWLMDLVYKRARLNVPTVSWFAVGFLGWALLSIAIAPSRYMVMVELLRQCKFFLVYLYAVNNFGSKQTLRWILILVLATVFVQGSVTIFRFVFDFYGSFFGTLFGSAEGLDLVDGVAREGLGEGWLGGLRNSFGTTMSPAVTSQLLLLGLPLAALACMRNPMFARRLVPAAVFAVGLGGLVLTFSRTSVIAGLAGLALCGLFGVRRGYISPRLLLLPCVIMAAALTVVSPRVYEYMTRRLDNVGIRFEQYTTGMTMIRANPLLGVGLNCSFQTAKDYSRFSYSLIDVYNRTYDQPIHSHAMALMIEVGIVGFLFYAIFFFGIGRTAWRLSRDPPDEEDGFSATVILLGLSGLGLGLLTNPLFDDGVQTLLWIYAGAIMAMEQRTRTPAHRA